MPTQEQSDYVLSVARAAFDRGDGLLQLQVEIGYLTGAPSSWGSSENALSSDPAVGWLLDQVERMGWRLEHAGYSFVETGGSSSARVFGTGEGIVNRGAMMGFYVFRRV